MNYLDRYQPVMRGILRILVGLLFLEHGLQKFLSFPPGPAAGIGPALGSPAAYAGIFELACGLLAAIGLFTRAAAFVASGVMAFAYWMVHAPQDPFPLNNGGDAAILYCFIFLYFVFAGPGAFSLDGLRRKAPKAS